MRKSTFVRNSGTMFSGIGIVRILSFAILPFLTRLYTTADFGLLGAFIAIVLIGKTVANGGYESAILLPEDEQDASALLKLCNIINVLVTIVLLVFAGLFLQLDFLSSLWGDIQSSLIILLIPISILFEAKANAYKNFLNRYKKYGALSYSIIFQTISTIAFQVLFGFIETPINGLILALLIGQFVLACSMFFFSKKEIITNIATDSIRIVSKKYKHFLSYGVIGNWINSLSNYIPYIFFQKIFGASLNGQFTMSNQKVMSAPINLVSAAVSPVYYESAVRAAKEGGSKLFKISKELSSILFIMILPPCILFILWGPALFVWLFGEEWRMAGEYARWLSPFMFIKFIVHPLSYLIDVRMKLKQQLVFNLIYLIITLTIFSGYFLERDHFLIIKCYGIASFSAYLIFFFYLLKLAKDPN